MDTPTNNADKKSFKRWPFLVALALFLLVLAVPGFDNPSAQRASALLVLIAALWITEAIPLALTGILVPLLAIVLQLADPTQAFAPFAHPIIFLFMGGFVLAAALSHYSLDQFIAQRLIRLARGNFYRSSVLLMLATALLACWVTNTSSVAMMIPLALGMLGLIQRQHINAESKFLMLGIAYSANIGGIITMVASPPNAIGASIMRLSFSQWTTYALPFFLIAFPAMVVLLTLFFKPDRNIGIATTLFQDKPFSPNRTVVVIFMVTVMLWILESAIAPLLGIGNGFNALVAILAIFLLFATGAMQWDQIINSIQWEILLLFGGGLTLGMLIETSGLGALIINQAADLITKVPLWLFLWTIVVFCIVLTEFMSNTASAALMLPLLYSTAIALNLNPILLLFPATIATSFGFMMPVGTPPNAMVFASGLVPRMEMFRAGALMNLLSSILITAYFYFIFRQ